MKKTKYFLLLILLSGCIFKQNPPHPVKFKIPYITHLQEQGPTHFFYSDSLVCVNPLLIGKYNISDTIDFNNPYLKNRTVKTDLIPNYRFIKDTDTLNTDGFTIIPDYQNTILFKEPYSGTINSYYAIYIVNETFNMKIFFAKDQSVFAIQEAQDTNSHQFYPVEKHPCFLCGNGYFGLKINPYQFVLILMPKYDGRKKGLMRVRLRNGETVYTSLAFEGKYNLEQFIEKDTSKAGQCGDFIGSYPKKISKSAKRLKR